MALYYIMSEIKRDICRKSRFFHTPLHSTPRLGSPRRNIATRFGVEKLEWRGDRMMEKFENMFTGFDTVHKRYGRTDGRTDTGRQHKPRLCGRDRGKKRNSLLQPDRVVDARESVVWTTNRAPLTARISLHHRLMYSDNGIDTTQLKLSTIGLQRQLRDIIC